MVIQPANWGWPGLGNLPETTGADRSTIAGTIAANAHGRGLKLKPLSVTSSPSFLSMRRERPVGASRKENPELFRLFMADTAFLELSVRAIAPRAEKKGRAGGGDSDGGRFDGRV